VSQGLRPVIQLLRDVENCIQVPLWMRAEAAQVLDRVFGEGICTECGNDMASEDYELCTDCLENLEQA